MRPIEDWLTQPDGLAARLRALRTQAGLSSKDLATTLGWQPSKASRLENGKQMPSEDDLRAWATGVGADQAVADQLVAQLGEAHAVHLDWKRRFRRGQAAVQRNYSDLLRDARVIRHFETAYIPGPLQTPEYARRVLAEMVDLHGSDANDIDGAVTERLARQRYLYEPGRRFEFLISEAVLRYLLVPADVMRGQLDRLQSVIGMPNIWFGILPFGVELPTAPQNSFQLYDDLAIVETFVGETTHTGDEADAYKRAHESLSKHAATGEAARRLILASIESVARTPSQAG